MTASRAPFAAAYWPTREQVWLLRAALLHDEQATRAWHAWRAAADLARLDAGSQRLLPLAAANLVRFGLDDPLLTDVETGRRQRWASSRLRIAKAAIAIRALEAGGIRTMLLKGAALTTLCRLDLGVRSMIDVDVLVPTVDAIRAMDVLRALGWRAARVPNANASVLMRHSEVFAADRDRHIDLHWHAVWEWSEPDADDDLWNRAQPAVFGDLPTRVPDPVGLFIVTVTHGLRINRMSPVRWAADAVAILRFAGPQFDWGTLVDHTERRTCVIPMRVALQFLTEQLDVPIPDDVHRRLRAHRSSLLERMEYRMRDVPPRIIGGLPALICRHARQSRTAGRAAVVWGLPRYLQRAYGVASLPALVWRLGAGLLRRPRQAAATPMAVRVQLPAGPVGGASESTSTRETPAAP